MHDRTCHGGFRQGLRCMVGGASRETSIGEVGMGLELDHTAIQ